MNKLLTIFLVSISLISSSYAQDSYTLGPATDLKETGLNKVLCMKNGNTMLFHFEPGKDLIIKVYDSTHKEIANLKQSCRLFDLYVVKDAMFKGLFEINGEAVLFIEQEHLSKYGLVRCRFNGNDGKLIDEKLMGESAGQNKRMRFYVMNNKRDDNYAILFLTDIPTFKDCKMNLTYFSTTHDVVKDVPVLLPERKKYDYMDLTGAEWQPEGICITTVLRKTVENGTYRSTSGSTVSSSAVATQSHDLAVFYIPDNSSTVKAKIVELGEDIFPYYTHFTFNGFARTLNVLMLSYQEYQYQFGLDMQPGAIKASVLFTFDEETMALKYKVIRNDKATTAYRQQTDTTKVFEGVPLKLYTNNNGLSTAVYRSFTRYRNTGAGATSVFDSYLGNMCITQFDDDGNEIWGTVLPQAQYFKSLQHYYFVDELARKWQDQAMFRDLPPQVYNRQFFSQGVYSKDKNVYIVYNDNDKNFNNTPAHPGDTVYNFSLTNACYYKMNGKKEVTKHYLFGAPATNEYKSAFVEGADFDNKRGIYASLVQYRKGDDITLRMAWSKLD